MTKHPTEVCVAVGELLGIAVDVMATCPTADLPGLTRCIAKRIEDLLNGGQLRIADSLALSIADLLTQCGETAHHACDEQN